jgi:hypothetical protein
MNAKPTIASFITFKYNDEIQMERVEDLIHNML